jgi:hypothetical protein
MGQKQSLLLRRKRQESNVSGTLNRRGQHALVPGTVAGNPARQDFAPLGNVFFQPEHVLVVDVRHLIYTEAANTLLAPAASFTFQAR